jgi:hypothetical protein
MNDYLGAPELPQNAPLPKKTPPSGVVISRTGQDGWTRKFLYRAGLGSDGKPWQKSFLVSEQPPRDLTFVPREPYEAPELPPSLPPAEVMEALAPPERPLGFPTSTMARPMALKLSATPMPMLGNARLGQAYPIGGGTLPPAPPAPLPEPLCPVGPMQMPDGRLLNPDDPITLADLCAMMPTFAKALLAPAPGRTGAVPLVGQVPGGAMPVAGASPFGAAPGGGGGFGFGGGGGGPGPQGPRGAAGAAGPAGAGTATDFVSKTDGDFTAGPGAFIPVPGTLLSFSIPTDGIVMFLVQATLGCDQTQNGALGIRVDGTDYPLTKRLIQTFAAGVEEFFQPSAFMTPISLPAGAHTAEVILRGLVAGSECSASGLGLSETVSASPETPLILIAQHSSASALAPTATALQVDGLEKTDGNFSNPGPALLPVPGTFLAFTVQAAGKAFFSVSANFANFAEFPGIHLGLRIDGVDQDLAYTREQQGAGDDHFEFFHMAASRVLDLSVGAHTVEVIYGCDGGGTAMDIEANATRPLVLSVIHP